VATARLPGLMKIVPVQEPVVTSPVMPKTGMTGDVAGTASS
jgi:hypothetical protein